MEARKKWTASYFNLPEKKKGSTRLESLQHEILINAYTSGGAPKGKAGHNVIEARKGQGERSNVIKNSLTGNGGEKENENVERKERRNFLMGLKLGELRLRAVEIGVDSEELEAARDEEEPKTAIITLLLDHDVMRGLEREALRERIEERKREKETTEEALERTRRELTAELAEVTRKAEDAEAREAVDKV